MKCQFSLLAVVALSLAVTAAAATEIPANLRGWSAPQLREALKGSDISVVERRRVKLALRRLLRKQAAELAAERSAVAKAPRTTVTVRLSTGSQVMDAEQIETAIETARRDGHNDRDMDALILGGMALDSARRHEEEASRAALIEQLAVADALAQAERQRKRESEQQAIFEENRRRDAELYAKAARAADSEKPRASRLINTMRACVERQAVRLASGYDSAYVVSQAAVSLCQPEIREASASARIAYRIPADAYNIAVEEMMQLASTRVVEARAQR